MSMLGRVRQRTLRNVAPGRIRGLYLKRRSFISLRTFMPDSGGISGRTPQVDPFNQGFEG